jgi:hypothetical protein
VWAHIDVQPVGQQVFPLAGAEVTFYWANPSISNLSPSTANVIGSETVNLNQGGNDVMCTTPWVPSYVNSGHECLIVTVVHASDPNATAIAPLTPFDPPAPNHRHIAQLNLGVAQAAGGGGLMMYSFGAGAPPDPERGDKRSFSVVVRRLPIERAAPFLERGRQRVPKEMPDTLRFGVQPARTPCDAKGLGKTRLTLSGRRARLQGMVLALRVPARAERGTGALVAVEQLEGKRVVGGIAVLVLGAKGRGGKKPARRARRASRGKAKRRKR